MGQPLQLHHWQRLKQDSDGCVCFAEYWNHGDTSIQGNSSFAPGYWSFPSNFVRYNSDGVALTFDNSSYEDSFGEFSRGRCERAGSTSNRWNGIVLDNPLVNFLPETNGEGELWFSCLLGANSSIGGTAYFGIQLSSSTSTGFGTVNGTTEFGVHGNSGTPTLVFRNPDQSFTYSSFTFAQSDTILVIAKIVFNGSANAELSVWAFKESDTFTPTEAGLGTPILYDAAAPNGVKLNTIRYGVLDSYPFVIDSIRLSEDGGNKGVNAVLMPKRYKNPFPGRLAIWQAFIVKNLGLSHQAPQIDGNFIRRRWGETENANATVVEGASVGITGTDSGDPMFRDSGWDQTYVPGDIGESFDTTRNYRVECTATVGTMDISKFSFFAGNAGPDRSSKIRIRYKKDADAWVESSEYTITTNAATLVEWDNLNITGAVNMVFQIYVFDTRESGVYSSVLSVGVDDISVWGNSNVL